MHTSMFGRLVWKEYREQRAFWLAMTCLALVVQTALRLWSPAIASPRSWLVWTALAVPALYAAGSSATLFAIEHERRTFGFLRMLPLGVWRLAAAKTTWSLASILGMQIVLWCTAAALGGGQFPRLADHRQALALCGFAALEALAWGIACSLLLRDPLKSVVATIFVTSVTVHLATWSVDWRTVRGLDLELYVAALRLRVLLLALVVAIDCWLLPRWLAERIPLALRPRRSGPSANAPGQSAASLFRTGRQLAHLSWQSWREARGVVLLLAVIGLVLLLLDSWAKRAFPNPLFPWLALMTLIAALSGTFVFRADWRQPGRRFLAQRGVSPALVWLSRQSVWAMIVAVWAASVIALPLTSFVQTVLRNGAGRFEVGDIYQSLGYRPLELSSKTMIEITWLAAASACIPLGYAAGQLASMFFQSGLIAAVVAMVLAVLVATWALLMQVLEISWSWSVAPVLVALLAATALRAKGWLVERHDVRSWTAPAAALLLPALILLLAVPYYRIHEIPQVKPVWPTGSEPKGNTFEGRQTLQLYLQAWDAAAAHWSRWDQRQAQDEWPSKPSPFDPPASPDARRIELVTECSAAIELALAASQSDECYFAALPIDPFPNARQDVEHLGYLLLMAGDVRLADGKLDEAWGAYRGALRVSRQLLMRDSLAQSAMRLAQNVFQRLPYWAAHDGQTIARIREAIVELRQFEGSLQPTVLMLRRNYQGSVAYIDNVVEPTAANSPSSPILPQVWIEDQLPWERARARRLLDYVTERDLQLLETLESRLTTSIEVASLFPDRAWWGLPPNQQTAAWLRTTPLVRSNWTGPQIAWDRVWSVDRYRTALTLLALEGWKLEHGSLPDRLDLLVGSYLDQLPIDPLSGAAYVYRPAGWPSELEISDPGLSARLPAGRPFIWTLLPRDQFLLRVVVARGQDDPDSPVQDVHYNLLNSSGYATSLSLGEALRYGWPFVIP